jgi:hypothetical protein
MDKRLLRRVFRVGGNAQHAQRHPISQQTMALEEKR